MLLTKSNKGKVQIFWVSQKIWLIFHFLFDITWLEAWELWNMGQICVAFLEYFNFSSRNSCTLNLPKSNILFHKDQLTVLLLPNDFL